MKNPNTVPMTIPAMSPLLSEDEEQQSRVRSGWHVPPFACNVKIMYVLFLRQSEQLVSVYSAESVQSRLSLGLY
jgi:hypothetical protein